MIIEKSNGCIIINVHFTALIDAAAFKRTLTQSLRNCLCQLNLLYIISNATDK